MNILLDNGALYDRHLDGLCPLCLAELPDGGGSCTVCAPAQTASRPCAVCAVELDVTARYCAACFASLEVPAQPPPAAAITAGSAIPTTRVCPRCGEPNPPSASRCTRCDASWEGTGSTEAEIAEAPEDVVEALEEIPETGARSLADLSAGEELTVAEPMRSCPLCGYENLARAEFCGACWGRLPASAVEMSTSRRLVVEDDLHERWKVHGVKTGFVGRARELSALSNQVDSSTRRRSCGVTVILGEGGIGKSRLVAELMRWLREHRPHLRILAAVCGQDEAMAALGPLERLLRERFELREHDGIAEGRDRVARAVTQVCPGKVGEDVSALLLRFLGLATDGEPATVPEDEARDSVVPSTSRLVGAVARFFAGDTKEVPLLVCVDEAHHASAEFLATLRHLLDQLEQAPLRVLLLARPELRTLHPEWFEGERPAAVLELGTLSVSESARVVQGILARAGFSDDLVREICERAGGNPLFLEELCRVALEEGPRALHAQGLPGSVDDAVRARLGFVSDTARAVLEMAAVVGNRFWLGAVVSLRRLETAALRSTGAEGERLWFGIDEDEEIRRALEELRGRDFVARNPHPIFPEEEEYLFKQTTERDLVYAEVPGGRSARWHRFISQWLLQRQGGDEKSRFGLAARHRELSGDTAGAARLFLAAADRARAAEEPERAAEFYERGIRLLPDEEIATRLFVLHGLGDTLARSGEHARALEWFREMLRSAWLLGDRAKSGAAYNRIGRLHRHLGRYDEAMAALSDGHTLFLEARDWRGVAASLDDIGQVHRRRGEYEQALYHFQEALQLRRELGDPRSIALSLYNMGGLERDTGRLADAQEHLEEALRSVRASQDGQGEASILSALGVLHHERGDVGRAEALWREAMEIARQVRYREVEGRILGRMGELSLGHGDTARARELLNEALELNRIFEDRANLPALLRNLSECHLRDGDIDRAGELATESLETAESLGSRLDEGAALRLLGEIHAQTLFDDTDLSGRASTAEAYFSRAVALFEEMHNDLELGRTLTSLGNCLLERGQIERGRAELLRAQELLEEREAARSLERARRTIGELS